MLVSFRCDASLQIGSGHVMRCLTLAQGLREGGHSCTFVCRDLPGQMASRIAEAEFTLKLLPAPEPGFVPEAARPLYADWAGVAWETDATQTHAALHSGFDWLVLDHYAFDARWQDAVRPAASRIMVIDDLADRPHAADLLLDQNLGRVSADYDGLLPMMAERLVGPRFALLRPEFLTARAHSLARRAGKGFELRHLLIFMGGIDLPDVTGQVLRALDAAKPPSLDQITVVMGPQAPAREAVLTLSQSLSVPTRVLVSVADMAEVMAEADLAIGAAGGTAWERCVLGLPSLVVILAGNQQGGAEALAARGAALIAGAVDDREIAEKLLHQIDGLSKDPQSLGAISAKAADVADGQGLLRVIRAMEVPLTLHPACMSDAQTVWQWRQALPSTAFVSGQVTDLGDHLRWFEAALASGTRGLWMAMSDDCVLGHMRLDRDSQGTASVSLLLSPKARGNGLGSRLLGLLSDLARQEGLAGLTAMIHVSNKPSRAAFKAAGFCETGQTDQFVHLCLRFRGLQT